jgi:hypothetical protein
MLGLVACSSAQPQELLTIVLSQAVWRKRLDVSSSLRASFVDLAHAVTSLAVHMIGAKPAKFLYKKEEDWEADRAVATSLNPSELLVGAILLCSTALLIVYLRGMCTVMSRFASTL